MSFFTHGFNLGFASGMFNTMFRGFNPFVGFNNCGGFFGFSGFNNFCGFGFMPSFFTPMAGPSIFNWTAAPTQPWNCSYANMNSIMNFGMTNNFDTFTYSMGSPGGGSYYTGTLSNAGTVSASHVKRNYSDLDTSDYSLDAEQLKNKWHRCKPELSQGFFNKVVKIAERINCSPNDLMCLMNAESGVSASAVNKVSGATGLIQFMPSTAEDLGTSCSALRNMSPEEQLNYVEKFLIKGKKAAGLGNERLGPGTLYALAFLPGRAGREILTTSGENYYKYNPGLDSDHDGKISKNDLAKRIRNNDV